jgi:hypothetical protein
VAYIFAAGLLTACIGDPNVFVLNHLATRETVHIIWEIAKDTVTNLVQVVQHNLQDTRWKKLNPDAAILYKQNMLLRFPEWRGEYESWEKRTGRVPHVDRFMCLCGHSRRSHLVTFFAESARHRWIDKVNANMDKDCSHYPELRNAPVNTDTTESGLGGLDYNLYKTLACRFLRQNPGKWTEKTKEDWQKIMSKYL